MPTPEPPIQLTSSNVTFDSTQEPTNDSGAKVILADLTEALSESSDDPEFIGPTHFAVSTVEQLTRSAWNAFGDDLPIPAFVQTGNGGMRAEWTAGTKHLRLHCYATPSEGAYLYFEHGEEYGVDKPIDEERLITRLNWLVAD